MSNIFEKVVNNIIAKTHFNSLDIARELDLKHEQVVEVIKLIYITGDYFMLSDKCQERWSLTNLGLTLMEDRKKLKFNLIESNQVQNNESDKETYFNLNRIKNGGTLENEEKLDIYEFKKYIEKTMIKYLEGEMINKDALIDIKLEFCVTEDMLLNDKWKTVSLLPYNFNEMATKLPTGNLNYIKKNVNNMRELLLEIGFIEKLSLPFIENPFWNNEALLKQTNADDNFTVNYTINNVIPNDFYNRIKHLNQEFYNNNVVDKDTIKPIIRANLNNIISRLLYEAAKNNEFPLYEFAIGNIISNNADDSLHLPEYHTAVIILIEQQLKFNHIFGLLSVIFDKLKIENVEYKPAFSSFTEPTLESICYHYGLDQWIRVGKSGMIRQEILKAMNFQENIIAIVLTLNIERLAMVKKNLMDINHLKLL